MSDLNHAVTQFLRDHFDWLLLVVGTVLAALGLRRAQTGGAGLDAPALTHLVTGLFLLLWGAWRTLERLR